MEDIGSTLNHYLQCYESHRGEKRRNLELKYMWRCLQNIVEHYIMN
jgi:hypothetical protein